MQNISRTKIVSSVDQATSFRQKEDWFVHFLFIKILWEIKIWHSCTGITRRVSFCKLVAYFCFILKLKLNFIFILEERLDIIDALINDMELLQEMQVSKFKLVKYFMCYKCWCPIKKNFDFLLHTCCWMSEQF